MEEKSLDQDNDDEFVTRRKTTIRPNNANQQTMPTPVLAQHRCGNGGGGGGGGGRLGGGGGGGGGLGAGGARCGGSGAGGSKYCCSSCFYVVV